jgi:signal transduction histidine kinase
MRLVDYLSDKKVLILLYLTTSLFTGAVIYMGESTALNNSYGLYVVFVSLFLFSIYLTVDFRMKKRHFSSIKRNSLSEGLDWVNSIPSPMSAEERIYYELLIKLYKDANEKMAEHTAKSIENLEFMTMWVHEIKTPIAASKLIIENSMNNPSEKVLYSIEDEINKIEDFVQMTLFYSRADDFAKDYIIHSTNLNKIVNDCVIREYSSITNKKLSLDMYNLDLKIDTDEKWLGFIIKQILDNAIKYSPVSGEIRIYAEQAETESVLYIEDSGVGIKAEDIDRVFDKSFTGNNGRKFYNSTGIGLYLSQKLARKLGYNISVSSEYGNGTKVLIHFPKWSDYYKMI